MKVLGMGLPELLMVLLVIGVPILIIILVLRRSKKRQPIAQPPRQQGDSLEGCDATQEQAPVLDTWKTSVGFSALGAFVGLLACVLVFAILAVLIGFIANRTGFYGEPMMYALLAFSTVVVMCILGITYAMKVYSSYFTSKPILRSSRGISLCNFAFGGIVFGALWNHGLTKRRKGVSHVVFVVLLALWLAGVGLNVIAASFAPTYVTEQRDGYSFEIPSIWEVQQFYEGVASYGPEGKLTLNVEEYELEDAFYPTADEQLEFLTQHVTDRSITDKNGATIEYTFTDTEAYQLGDHAMVQATMSVHKNGSLNAKHSLLLFFVSESEYVSMMYLSEPESFEAIRDSANRIFESVRLD